MSKTVKDLKCYSMCQLISLRQAGRRHRLLGHRQRTQVPTVIGISRVQLLRKQWVVLQEINLGDLGACIYFSGQLSHLILPQGDTLSLLHCTITNFALFSEEWSSQVIQW